MKSTSIRNLADKTSAVLKEVADSREPTVITNRGNPVALIVPLDQDKIEQAILAGIEEP